MCREKKTIIASFDTQSDIVDTYDTIAPILESGLRTLMGAPLISRGQVIGALSFASKEKQAYSDEDKRIAQNVADQIVGAMVNVAKYLEHQDVETQLLISQDVLEARVLERTIELQDARDIALMETRAKSQFLANMSHELRTPLNAVIGYSELLTILATKNGDQDYILDLNNIRSSGMHLLNLVDEILDLARVESGKLDLYLEQFDVTQVVDDAMNISRQLIQKNGNTLELACPKGIGLIKADETRLCQALCNLLSNAGKFTEDGTVSLVVKRVLNGDIPMVNFVVTDTGIGISPEALGRLFTPFSQADSSTGRKYGGTGLGLALSREFCRMMGGDITVMNEVGKGSEFVISVPETVEKPGSLTAQAKD